MINQHITIFIPTYNNETTILDTLQSIERQKTNQIRKIIIIDDGSTDQTIDLINNHIKTSHIEFNFIKNTKPTGLSRKYNKAIDLVKTELLIIMHADIVIERNNAIEKYYKIMENESNVAAISKIRHRFEDWKKFTFWEKCEFDRFLMSQRHFLAAKFDIYRVSALKKVGKFDAEKYYAGGEDADLWLKLEKLGNIIKSENVYIHKQSFAKDYSLFRLIYRSARYAEAAGAVLKNHYSQYSLIDLMLLFFREFLTLFFVIGLVIYLLFEISLLLIAAIFLFILFSFANTKNTYLYSGMNPRILILPFVNVCLIFVSNFFVLRGFIRGKEVL
ncbi:MAG: hypothetical protein A3B38_02015 [Candidatus Levybacteria bacterium RIFCSPLOWO2_01_FULL_36_13]|nr:MAG: hypothetical protein A2684_03250 [Candidatus Levybacteria bacterium RIFCSPHIGHO2_01_FULL_36_15b]OGH35638.1 MAG: hypothetical protein A3B38_02015 [Candidatus Levybacteria bacterium RIFCSPLOWO2_01_FULL_36_13]